MRLFILKLVALVLLMASLPLHLAFAERSNSNYEMVEIANGQSEEQSPHCLKMPLSSIHHSSVHCSMNFPIVDFYSHLQLDVDAVRFPNDNRIRQAFGNPAVHFRPPIYS